MIGALDSSNHLSPVPRDPASWRYTVRFDSGETFRVRPIHLLAEPGQAIEEKMREEDLSNELKACIARHESLTDNLRTGFQHV